MMSSEDSDGALVARAVDGNRAAFAALLSRHYDFMFRIAWKCCGNRDDAEDVAQDVCIKLPKAIATWSGDTKFTTWLYRVVLNAVRDLQRRQQSNIRKLDDWANDAGRSLFVEADDGSANEDSELWLAVRALPPKQRDAVLLVYGEDMTHAEAAKAMECAEGTISSHIHDARKKLKSMLVGEPVHKSNQGAEQRGQAL